MKRTKKYPTWKTRALRRVLVLAVFLAALLVFYQPSFTPGQVIHATEDLLGLEKTEVIGHTEVLGRRVTFSANQNALLATVFQPLHPIGGAGTQPLAVLDAPTEVHPASFYAIAVWDGAQQEATILAFGQTCLEDAAKVRFYSHRSDDSGIFLDGELLSCPTGRGYLLTCQSSPAGSTSFLPTWYQVLGQEGDILYTGSLPQTGTTSPFD